MREQERFLDANFEKLSERHLPECSEIKTFILQKKCCNCWCRTICKSGITVIETISKQYHDFATGHIAGTLLREGIIPDAIIITDPQPHMYQQVKGLDTKKDSIDTSVDSVLVCSGLL